LSEYIRYMFKINISFLNLSDICQIRFVLKIYRLGLKSFIIFSMINFLRREKQKLFFWELAHQKSALRSFLKSFKINFQIGLQHFCHLSAEPRWRECWYVCHWHFDHHQRIWYWQCFTSSPLWHTDRITS
jgi:hypothetical protein